jgi:hypothetical protein
MDKNRLSVSINIKRLPWSGQPLRIRNKKSFPGLSVAVQAWARGWISIIGIMEIVAASDIRK